MTLDDLNQAIHRDLAARRWRIRASIDPAETALTATVTTPNFVYSIAANAEQDYLSCDCRTRFNVPGKGHPEFADLPDGKLTAETWQAIVAEIKRLELKPYRGPAL